MSTIDNTNAQALEAWRQLAVQSAQRGDPVWFPLTNAAAVYAAVAALSTSGGDCAQYRALRVSPTWQTEWDPAPVVPVGMPGSNQERAGLPGYAWPIYSRDMPVAKGCLTFLIALATEKPVPLLSPPKAESGLYQALQAGVQGTVSPVSWHALAPAFVNLSAETPALTAVALVWVQRVESELGPDGEPVTYPPRPIAVRLDMTLSQLVRDPHAIHIPAEYAELAGLRECIVDRLTKQRMRGRKAGVPNKPKAPGDSADTGGSTGGPDGATLQEMQAVTERAERAEAEVNKLQTAMAQMASTYAQQLQALAMGTAPAGPTEPMVPADRAAGYLVAVIKMLPPNASQAEFQALAGHISASDPDLFKAIALRLQGA